VTRGRAAGAKVDQLGLNRSSVARMSRTLLLLAGLVAACHTTAPAGPAPSPTAAAEAEVPPPAPLAPRGEYMALSRADFNASMARDDIPLFWIDDVDHDGSIDPDEIASLLFHDLATERGPWLEGGAFTPAFKRVYAAAVAHQPCVDDAGADPEQHRRCLVEHDVDGARATLVLTMIHPGEGPLFAHLLHAAALIDELYELQKGTLALRAQVAKDPPSRALFDRAHGPRCVTSKLERVSACTAIPGVTKVAVDAYPAELQQGDTLCATLEARKDAAKLLGPFTVVRKDARGGLVAVPYSQAYAERSAVIAAELRAAAKASPQGEDALDAYLEAAAKAFENDDWVAADEAWARMNARNSRYYLRVGPDETYWEPCAHKAGYHLTFARINQGSLAWQAKLDPVQQDMEAYLAAHATSPYKQRKVAFHLPDFIDIIVNAGDDRSAVGATIGQSLPNFGKVAEQSRGRTVAMSNLYTDADSQAARHSQAASLFDEASMKLYPDDAEPGLVATILHEAAHNLGPAQGYKAHGKTDDQAFGGPLAAMLEELKAQHCGLMLVRFLVDRKILGERDAARIYMDALVWALGHISEGMTTAEGDRKTYPQLAAIQVGFLLENGALVWDAKARSAGGDVGAFHLDLARLPDAIDALGKEILAIKAQGDKARALTLTGKYVDGQIVPFAVITERWLRSPRVNFVYAVAGPR
jgi:hypothetical protein